MYVPEHQRLSAHADRQRLRHTFDSVAQAYDRTRRSYPFALFQDLVQLTALRPRSRVLEIGCGTGLATQDLARFGFDIVGVELGPHLAALARDRLHAYRNVEIVNADFDTWLPDVRFAAVVAFAAFHWLDTATRYQRAATVLGHAGALAIVQVDEIRDPRTAVGAEDLVLAAFDDFVPGHTYVRAPDEHAVPTLETEILSTGLFSRFTARRYTWAVNYRLEDYLTLLDSYSVFRALEQGVRDRLTRIRANLRDLSADQFTTAYVATLNIAWCQPTA